jgi:hypothetical protein
LIVQVARKEFRYYFAIACIKIGAEKNDDIEKVRYLNRGLDSYNKYLRRRLNFEIKDLENVGHKIAYEDSKEKDKLLKYLFEDTTDKFDLIRRLSKFLNLTYPENLLRHQKYRVQLAEISPFLAAVIIPIIVAIIQLYTEIIT